MMTHKAFTLALLASASLAWASAAQAQSSPAKKELVAKVLQYQQPAIESLARGLAERPAMQIQQQAAAALQSRIPAEKQEAVGKEIQADLRKYVDEAVPLVRDRAVKLAPTTIGAVLEEKFTEEELKQLIAVLESPVSRKFQQLGPDMQKALAEKLVAETGPLVQPKVAAMEQSIAKRLSSDNTARPAAPGQAPAAKPATPAAVKPPASK